MFLMLAVAFLSLKLFLNLLSQLFNICDVGTYLPLEVSI